MESTKAPQEVHLTAWHIFLVELIRYFADPRRVDVRDFVKLGALPLEADVILLLKKEVEASARLQHMMGAELDFMESRLRALTVLEYKSPRDPLRRVSVDTARVYGLLAKQKYGIEQDRQVSILLLYSQLQAGLFEDLRDDGLAFEPEEDGIRVCRGSMVLYAVDLVELGRKRPRSPLNLVSARHQEYSQDPSIDQDVLALVQRIQYLIKQGKVKGMALDKLPGYKEITSDAESIRRRFLEEMTPRERLEGLAPEERLEGLAPSERLKGLAPSEMDELFALLQSLRKKRG